MSRKVCLARSKKRAFTLLEIMVCLAILSLLGALVGIKGGDLLSHHKFHSSLQTWLFALQRSQIAAMNQRCDIACTFKKNKETGSYQVFFRSEHPFFTSEVYDLKETSQIFFEGKLLDEIEIVCLTTGRILPQGNLQFTRKKEAEPPLFLPLSYPVAFSSKPSPALSPPPFDPNKKQSTVH